MLSLSRAIFVFATAAWGVFAQVQSNETEVPFGLRSPSGFTQCKNTTIVWQGGKPPYKLSIRPVCGTGQNASEEVHDILPSGSTSIELPIQFVKGTPLVVSITDSSNMQATAPETVVASGDADDSCTTQTACTDGVQAPSVPVVVADPTNQPSSTAFPTDRLVTGGPSDTSAQIRSTTDSRGSTMVIVYSYLSQTPAPTSSATESLESQSNGTIPTSQHPAFTTLALMVVFVTRWVLEHW
ncbi:unnamed protein product [Rhizoctonia solani]|uniref:Uncharacterized protein n=1 Tax=Rhizoctonia solani TaxID=456999 RepID=A0A8H3C4C3_9AGAM|nr:unnamed protein product [Rhizoctonia solani]